MSDLMQSAMTWLEGKREALLTGSVTYSRGVTSLVMNATMGATEYEQSDSDGMLTAIKTKDFIVRKADFDATFGKPQTGDQVVQIVNGATYTYEVNSPTGEQPFSRDPYELSLRINTQAISEA